jgi:hypothetical protein
MKNPIHYINNGKGGIYGKTVFVEEAKRLGVNRAFPIFIAKKIKFGDRIYTAIYEKDPKKPNKERWLDGTANVFGYFVVSSLNIVGNVQPVYTALGITPQSSGPTKIQRSCGSYSIAHVAQTQESMDKIIAEIEKQKLPCKIFLGGNFYDYETIINPINFSRSVVYAEFDDITQVINDCVNELKELTNYVKR